MATLTLGHARTAAALPFRVAGSLVATGPLAAAMALANVAAFTALVALAPPEGLTSSHLLAWGGNHGPSVMADGEGWRLLSYGFLHAGALHLLANTLAILTVGAFLCRELGPSRFLALHVSGILAGGFAFAAFGPANAVSVGASGGVFALAGALAALAIRRHPRVSPRSLAVDLSLMAAFSAVAGVDWLAHAGGFAAGLALGLAMTRAPRKPAAP